MWAVKQPPLASLGSTSLSLPRYHSLSASGEHEVPGAGQLTDQIVRVPEAGIDEGVDPRFPEVRQRLPVSVRVDLDRRQLSSGPAHRPGDPRAEWPVDVPDLESAREAFPDDEIVQDLVRLRTAR